MAILKVKDANGNVIDIPAIKGEPGKDGENYILTDADKAEIVSKVLDELPENGGSTTRPTAQKEFTQDDTNFSFFVEGITTNQCLYAIFFEADIDISEGTEIADIEVIIDELNDGEYISFKEMFKFGNKPFVSVNDKVYLDDNYGYVMSAIYFPLGINNLVQKIDSLEWASARITYYTN